MRAEQNLGVREKGPDDNATVRAQKLTAEEQLCQRFALWMLVIGMAAGLDARCPRGVRAFVAAAVSDGTMHRSKETRQLHGDALEHGDKFPD